MSSENESAESMGTMPIEGVRDTEETQVTELVTEPTQQQRKGKKKVQGKKKVFLEKESTLSLLEEIADKEDAVVEKKSIRLKKQLERDRETRAKIKKKRRERRVELKKFKNVIENEKTRKKQEKAAIEEALRAQAANNEGKKSVSFA